MKTLEGSGVEIEPVNRNAHFTHSNNQENTIFLTWFNQFDLRPHSGPINFITQLNNYRYTTSFLYQLVFLLSRVFQYKKKITLTLILPFLTVFLPFFNSTLSSCLNFASSLYFISLITKKPETLHCSENFLCCSAKIALSNTASWRYSKKLLRCNAEHHNELALQQETSPLQHLTTSKISQKT